MLPLKRTCTENRRIPEYETHKEKHKEIVLVILVRLMSVILNGKRTVSICAPGMFTSITFRCRR